MKTYCIMIAAVLCGLLQGPAFGRTAVDHAQPSLGAPKTVIARLTDALNEGLNSKDPAVQTKRIELIELLTMSPEPDPYRAYCSVSNRELVVSIGNGYSITAEELAKADMQCSSPVVLNGKPVSFLIDLEAWRKVKMPIPDDMLSRTLQSVEVSLGIVSQKVATAAHPLLFKAKNIRTQRSLREAKKVITPYLSERRCALIPCGRF